MPTATQLNASQVLILQTLARVTPRRLSTSELADRSAAVCSAGNLGPVIRTSLDGDRADTRTAEDYPDSLYALGLVKPYASEGEYTTWGLTSKGMAAAERYIARGVSARGLGIPHKILDPLIKKMKTVRTYGLNQWTNDDVKELRDQLPEEYQDVTVEVLRTKIVQRRQAGAFADPDAKPRNAAKATLKAFGPDGEIEAGLLTDTVIARLNAILNAE